MRAGESIRKEIISLESTSESSARAARAVLSGALIPRSPTKCCVSFRALVLSEFASAKPSRSEQQAVASRVPPETAGVDNWPSFEAINADEYETMYAWDEDSAPEDVLAPRPCGLEDVRTSATLR